MTIDVIFPWAISALSIVGVLMNIKKYRECFYIWTFTNASWMIVDYLHGIYAQSLLFLVYTGLAIYGTIEWRKKC